VLGRSTGRCLSLWRIGGSPQGLSRSCAISLDESRWQPSNPPDPLLDHRTVPAGNVAADLQLSRDRLETRPGHAPKGVQELFGPLTTQPLEPRSVRAVGRAATSIPRRWRAQFLALADLLCPRTLSHKTPGVRSPLLPRPEIF
jgi:hypothetical protein